MAISRRTMCLISGSGLAAGLQVLPTLGIAAETKSAVAVAREGTFDPADPSLTGLSVCAAGVGSTGDYFARKNRAQLVINMPLRARIDSVRQGRCAAAIFVSSDKTAEELIEEIMVFFFPLEGFEFVELALD